MNISWKQLLEKTALIFIFVYAVFKFFLPIETEDSWWHLATGKWIVEHRQVPHENVFSLTAEQKPWVFTQWLGSTIIYLSYVVGGEVGVKIFRDAIFVIVIGMFFVYARRKISSWLLAVLLIVLIHGLLQRTLLRPLMFNFIFIQMFLQILFRYIEKKDWRILIWIPITGILWSNIHLGSFVYGYLLIGIFWFNSFVEWLNTRFRSSVGLKHLSLLALMYAVSFIISPYGLDAAIYPFKVFLLPKFINFYHYNAVIQEMLPPVYILSLSGAWFWILTLLTGVSLWVSPRDRFLKIILFVVPLFMFLQMARGQEIFVLVCLYLIVESLKDGEWKRLNILPVIQKIILMSAIIFVLVSLIQLWNQKIFKNGQERLYWLETHHVYDPQPVVKLLQENHIEGNVFCSDVIGGYLLWSAYPRLKPFVDGRQLDQDLYAAYVAVKSEPEKYWNSISQQFQLNSVVMDMSVKTSYALVEYLSRQPDWQLVFIDGVYVVYVKRGFFQLNGETERFEEDLNKAVIHPQDLVKLREFSQSDSQKSFLNPPLSYIELLEEGTTLLGLGFEGEGVRRIRESSDLKNNQASKEVIGRILKYLEAKSPNSK